MTGQGGARDAEQSSASWQAAEQLCLLERTLHRCWPHVPALYSEWLLCAAVLLASEIAAPP